MKDIALYETGDGGDLLINNNDLSSTEILIHQVYLCLFGGNIESDTKGNELKSQIRDDWWANSLIFKNRIKKQFNSRTERILNKVVLNSSGRIEIENSVKEDLKDFTKIISLSVSVKIPSPDRVDILISLKEKENKEQKTLQFIWDNAKKEIILNKDL